jgi:hypothetical protein
MGKLLELCTYIVLKLSICVFISVYKTITTNNEYEKQIQLIYHNLQFYPVYKFLNTIKYPIALKHSVESWRSV